MEMHSKASAAAGKRNKKSKGGNGPAPQAIRYNGPVQLPNKNEQMVMVNLAIPTSMSTTSSASLANYSNVFSSADVTSATDWNDFKSLYSEARVVGMRVKFIPKFRHAVAASSVPATGGVNQSTAVTPLFLCISHSESTALTSLDQAVNHMSRKEASINEQQVCEIKMKESDEAQWFSTQSGTVNVMSIKTWFAANTAGATDALTWGYFIVTFAVQFRTRSLTATALKSGTVVNLPPKPVDFGKDEKSSSKSKSWF